MSLATQFDWSPPSFEIAEQLTTEGRELCDHARCPCVTFCGVDRDLPAERMRGVPRWRPIPIAERAEWFGRVYGLIFRDRERRYDAGGVEALRKHDAMFERFAQQERELRGQSAT